MWDGHSCPSPLTLLVVLLLDLATKPFSCDRAAEAYTSSPSRSPYFFLKRSLAPPVSTL